MEKKLCIPMYHHILWTISRLRYFNEYHPTDSQRTELIFSINEMFKNRHEVVLKEKLKIWNVNPPKAETSVICRMFSGYIKMCHWTGSEWLDMWKDTLEGEVVEWMYIPYD